MSQATTRSRHALVTGGATGIGAAIVKKLLGEGMKVTICGRREAPLRALEQSHENLFAVPADVTSETAIAELFDAARNRFGAIDVVVCNAGAGRSAAVGDTSLELWQEMLAVNLTGAFLTARAGLDDMQKLGGGRIVFIASTAGIKGYPYVSAYCAAKHGVLGLMRALALETAKSGITVNAVCPGFTETDMLEDALGNIMRASGRDRESATRRLAATSPLGRFIKPDEVASAVAWLCQPENAAVTGLALPVAGGEV